MDGVQGEAMVHVDAPPDEVYALVSDVTRMGDWSPETYRAEWIEGATGPEPGARFKGYNKQRIARWSRAATVRVADPGREFTFETGRPEDPETRWSYTLQATGDGTDLTESFESIKYGFFYKLIAPPEKRAAKLRSDAEQTLQRIKAVAEGIG